jgi:outer membrane protein insertion porin family
VKEIVFTGNNVFSDGKLRGQMKKIKPAGFWNLSWLGGKSTYTPDKWLGNAEDREGDQGRLNDFYLNHGYVTARIGEPKITYLDDKGSSKKKPKKGMRLEIPVVEGDQYRVGDIKFEGLTVFKEEGVRPLFKLKTGDVYNDSKLKKGYDKLRDIYGSQGYFQWTGSTKREPDPAKKVVNLVLSMEEDKRYFVGQIKFTGNETTRDKVIRREVYMNEGDVFNTEALKQSIRRINQLGYFKPMEGAPQLQPNPKADDKLDVTFKVNEQNRNQFTFGGGFSGLEGAFLNASFSTANFLGLGETFQISAQTGNLTRNYQIAITEPYLFDRPITSGIDLFKRRLTYRTQSAAGLQGYTDERTGASVLTGFSVGRWTRTTLSYSYQIIDVSLTDTTGTVNVGIINPIFVQDVGRRQQSMVSPGIVRNTVDSPFTPRRGTRLTLSLPVAGGPLGGTVDFVSPTLETVAYVPHWSRTALGVRAQGGWIVPYGQTAVIDPATGRDGLPFYQRYFLGGENQIRGYDVQTVGPRNASGQAIGGNKFILFNAEYYFDVFGPVRLLLFYDAGQSFAEAQPVDLHTLRISTGAELRFVMPVLNVPFRLIYAQNYNRSSFQPAHAFKFAVGTTF